MANWIIKNEGALACRDKTIMTLLDAWADMQRDYAGTVAKVKP